MVETLQWLGNWYNIPFSFFVLLCGVFVVLNLLLGGLRPGRCPTARPGNR
jgi:hypothetical protein